MKNQRHHHTPGFTVIELLVVISIVSLLVSVLLPAIGHAREIARRAICQSNLRQMYVSVEGYASESKGWFPGVFGLGQGPQNEDNSLSCVYNNDWMWKQNNYFAVVVEKGITRCPSQEDGIAQKKWVNAGSDDNNPYYYGTTDYDLKACFGSNHIATNNVEYDDPSVANFWSFRGMYDWRFPHSAQGYALNYREEQPRWWRDPTYTQRLDSIFFMDKGRSPAANSQDGTIYWMKHSNHPDGGGVAAEITNIVTKNGQVRAMYMTAVWGKPDYSMNYYDMNGYGEGRYDEYVDDQIAQNWW